MTNPLAAPIRVELANYLQAFPEEAARQAPLSKLLEDPEWDLVNRKNMMQGHLTTSALVMDPKLSRFLLIHHIILERWVQPGGHFEDIEIPVPSEVKLSDPELWASAGAEYYSQCPQAHIYSSPLWLSSHREVEEETGVWAYPHPWTAKQFSPLDIDMHAISPSPKRNEGWHYHFDFVYLAIADSVNSPLNAQLAEVHASEWVMFEDLEKVGTRMKWMAQKLKRFGLAS